MLAVATLVLLVAGCSAADARADADAVDEYDAALAPLKKRSDVLERRFAAAQAARRQSPEQLREVLAVIVPEYARLLEETRAIRVDGDALAPAHAALVASLERQQDGLELALRGIDTDDPAVLAEAGHELAKAQALVERHRRLLARARTAEAQ